jgi:hypothetical protein
MNNSEITPMVYLVSIKYNDLRDYNNKQLKLHILYDYIYRTLSKDIYEKFKIFLQDKINKYINFILSSEPQVVQSFVADSFVADSVVKYNKIYKSNLINKLSTYDKLSTLKIYDKGSTFNNDTETFGSIPFYIDIYTFINFFPSLETIHLFGDFSTQFYQSDITENLTQPVYDIVPNIKTLMLEKPFNTIKTLICNNVNINSLNKIISLFSKLTTITIIYVDKVSGIQNIKNYDDKDTKLYISKLILQLRNSIQNGIKVINISKLLEFHMQNNEFYNLFIRELKKVDGTLTYND